MNKRILIISMASLMVLACNTDNKTKTSTDIKLDKGQIQTEIQKLENAYQESLNLKNTDGIKDFYADDARTYMYGKPVGLGKAAIIEGIQKDYTTAPKGNKISFSIKDILISNDGGQVVEIGGFKIADTADKTLITGHYFALFEKREGKYVCVREMITPDTASK